MCGFFKLTHAACMLLVVVIQEKITLAEKLPADREDVMGTYSLKNKEQCRRLCWYRPLCSTFSYNAEVDKADIPSCVLHAGSTISQKTSPASSNWTEHTASGNGITNGCKSRPCLESEVCVPVPMDDEGLSQYRCLPFPAVCPMPNVINADVAVRVYRQNDTATVTCHPGFVEVPRGVDNNITCQVTSKWTAFNGSCEQAVYREGQIHENKFLGIPWPMTEGWEMCMKGSFLTNGQLLIYFLPQRVLPQRGKISITNLHFSLRYKPEKEPEDTRVLWNTFSDTDWKTQMKLGDMPIKPGENFTISFNIVDSKMNLVFLSHNNVTLFVGLNKGSRPDVTDSKYVSLGDDNTIPIFYVNTVSGC